MAIDTYGALGLQNPVPGTEDGTWGDPLNANRIKIVSEFRAFIDYGIAGENLSQYTVVGFNSAGEFIHCDGENPIFVNNIFGITLDSANLGAPVLVRSYGIIEEQSWNWNAGVPLYFDLNGQLTEDSGAQSSFNCVVARTLSSTKFKFFRESSLTGVEIKSYYINFQLSDVDTNGYLYVSHNLYSSSVQTVVRDHLGRKKQIVQDDWINDNTIRIDCNRWLDVITGDWSVKCFA